MSGVESPDATSLGLSEGSWGGSVGSMCVTTFELILVVSHFRALIRNSNLKQDIGFQFHELIDCVKTDHECSPFVVVASNQSLYMETWLGPDYICCDCDLLLDLPNCRGLIAAH